MHRIALVASLLMTILIIGSGIVSNHSSTIAAALTAGDWTYRLKVAAMIVPIWAVACWPWFVSLLRSSNGDRTVPAIAFSTLALALAAYMRSGIASAPSEGVGWYVIIYYLAVWALYLVTLLLRRR
jgi:hypothetical protein